MLFCLYKSSCGNSKKEFEASYQCCNSCSSKTCTDRCKDDCRTCGLSSDRKWVEGLKDRWLKSTSSSSSANSPKPKAKDNGQDLALKKAQDELRAVELAKKEARKKRREARKERAKNPNLD